MRTNILDEALRDENTPNSMHLVAIGILIFLSVVEVQYIVNSILIDFIIEFELATPFGLLTIKILTALLVFIMAHLLVIPLKRGKTRLSKNTSLYLRNLIILFVITQVIQFAYPFIIDEIGGIDFLDKKNEHYITKGSYGYLGFVPEIFSYLNIAIILYVILKR